MKFPWQKKPVEREDVEADDEVVDAFDRLFQQNQAVLEAIKGLQTTLDRLDRRYYRKQGKAEDGMDVPREDDPNDFSWYRGMK